MVAFAQSFCRRFQEAIATRKVATQEKVLFDAKGRLHELHAEADKLSSRGCPEASWPVYYFDVDRFLALTLDESVIALLLGFDSIGRVPLDGCVATAAPEAAGRPDFRAENAPERRRPAARAERLL